MAVASGDINRVLFDILEEQNDILSAKLASTKSRIAIILVKDWQKKLNVLSEDIENLELWQDAYRQALKGGFLGSEEIRLLMSVLCLQALRHLSTCIDSSSLLFQEGEMIKAMRRSLARIPVTEENEATTRRVAEILTELSPTLSSFELEKKKDLVPPPIQIADSTPRSCVATFY